MKKQKYLLPILALVIANVLWGINTVLIKIGLETIPVPIFMSIRFLTASLVILPFAVHTWRPLKRRDLLLFILSSIFALTLSALMLNIGLSKTSAFNASVIWSMAPIVMFVLSAQVLKERMKLTTFFGILIALAGTIVIIGRPEATDANTLTGNLFIVVSVFCGAIGTIICKPLMKKVSDSQATFMSLFPGIVPVAIYALTQLPKWDMTTTSSRSITGLIWSTIAVIFANYLFYYGLRYKRAQETGIYQYIHPTVAIIAAWFILGERPSPGFVLGAALVFAGIYFAEIRRTKLRPHSHHKARKAT